MDQERQCLYFDDQIDDQDGTLVGTIDILEGRHKLLIKKVNNLFETEKELRTKNYDLVFLDIRIFPEKGGGIDGRPWQRTGIALINRIRNGVYETTTPRNIPIIVFTAVTALDALEEIKKIGEGEQINNYKFALFEKPGNVNTIAEQALEFLK